MVLIGILVLTLIATFFLGALLQMSPGRLRRTVQDERHDNAAAAARAGVEYCLARLAEDPQWKGQGNGTIVQSDTMVVREDHGNVTGWMKTDSGDWAGFRLRFNYQDGDGGADGMAQPARLLHSQAISLNNLEGPSAVHIPLGNGPDYSFTDQPGQRGFSVPENSVALVVEGLVGPGVSPDSASGVTEGLESSGGTTLIRSLEGIYTISSYSEGTPDGAVLQVGGNSHFVLGNGPSATSAEPTGLDGFLRLTASDQTAIMRTKGSSVITQGSGKSSAYNFYPDMHSDVRVGKPGFSPHTKAGQEFSQTSEAANAALTEIEWSKVATSEQPDRLHLPAGVYAIAEGDTDSTDLERIHYFPMTFAEYRQKLAAGEVPQSAPVPEGFLSRVALNGRDWTAPDGHVEKRDLITFEKDIEIDPVDGRKDLAIVPIKGVKQKSRSDLTATIPLSQFTTSVSPQDKESTGLAILDYVAARAQQPSLSFNLQGTDYTYDSASHTLTGGDAKDVAAGVLSGGTLTLPGLTASLPGTLPLGSGTSSSYLSNVIDSLSGSSGLQITDPNAFMAAVEVQTGNVPDSVLEKNVDPLLVPDAASNDKTVPQDLEITFAPAEGQSAAIRTDGNVLLGTHLSGVGGAVVAGGRVDIIGLGVDLNAGQGERDGVSLYSKKDINISTYDSRRNKYWDASIKGVIFAKGNLTVRLGETSTADEPDWGRFDYMGAAIVLGDAPVYTAPPVGLNNTSAANGTNSTSVLESSLSLDAAQLGNASFTASGIRLFYEPKFLAPYIETDHGIPVFSAVSVLEK